TLVNYARDNEPMILSLIVDKTYFFAKYLDSRRHSEIIRKARDDASHSIR
ncbi:TPA: Replication protein RepB, partial [Streptococcus suis]